MNRNLSGVCPRKHHPIGQFSKLSSFTNILKDVRNGHEDRQPQLLVVGKRIAVGRKRASRLSVPVLKDYVNPGHDNSLRYITLADSFERGIFWLTSPSKEAVVTLKHTVRQGKRQCSGVVC
jgi:hypothetical protein